MIAATVADDNRLNRLSTEAALVYLMAIPQLDRDGLILAEPTYLWGKVCPRRPQLLPHMDGIVKEWSDVGLVQSYPTDDGDNVLHFLGFHKNQTLHYEREAASRYPCPPGYVRTPKGLVPETEVEETEEVRSKSGGGPDPGPRKVVVIEVKESSSSNGKEEEPQQPPPSPEDVEKYKAFVKAHETIWGLPVASPYDGERIAGWAKRVTLAAFEYALQEALNTRNIGNWKYTETILRRVEKEGLKSAAPVVAATVQGRVAGFSVSSVMQ
jgi:hypothetical protein